MLDEELTPLYDEYKRAYAEILHRWNLLDARAQVLKYLSISPEPHKGVEFLTDCSLCSRPVHGPACTYCNHLSLQCVICHISVRGSSNFCVVCGHGGHTTHMWLWFQKETHCPTGCGCHCLTETSAVMEP